MLLKLLQTRWENKEKMMQHIIVIVSWVTHMRKTLKGKNPYVSLENNKYALSTTFKTPVGKIESMAYDSEKYCHI